MTLICTRHIIHLKNCMIGCTLYMENVLKLYLQDTMQVRYQVMTEQLPIHKDYDSKGVHKVLNYHITTGGDNVYTRWWDMPEDVNLIFAHGFLIIIWVTITTNLKNIRNSYQQKNIS